MPFCVAGMGDLLALFRCISCRFNFGADLTKPEALGAPGRVFTTGLPELSCNVQQYPREAYLRRAEAEQCRVQSSMLLPLFSLPSTGEPRPESLGVIEVVQTSDDMAFLPVTRLLGAVLLRCGLHTSTVQEVQARLPTQASSLELPLRTGVLEDDQQQQQHQLQQQQHPHAGGESGGGEGEGGSSAGDRKSTMQKMNEDDDDEEEEDEPEEEDEEEDEGSDDSIVKRARRGTARHRGSGGRGRGGSSSSRGRGRGKVGKPGIKLTLADLQGQFGVGLKEAAQSLGVCTTTLKRACRRHGIQRWPRRALQKVSRTLDEMERRGAMNNVMGGAVPVGYLLHPTTGQLLVPPPLLSAPMQEQMAVDTRWAALANMIGSTYNNFNGQDDGMGGGVSNMVYQITVPSGAGIPPLHVAPLQQQQQQPQQPSPSDFSLEGAVTMNNDNDNPDGGIAIKREAVTIATTATTTNNQQESREPMALFQAGGTAAAARAAVVAKDQRNQVQVQQQSQVPSFLRPDLGDGQRRSFESPFASFGSDKNTAGNAKPTGGRQQQQQQQQQTNTPGISMLNFSQLTLPSFPRGFSVGTGAGGGGGGGGGGEGGGAMNISVPSFMLGSLLNAPLPGATNTAGNAMGGGTSPEAVAAATALAQQAALYAAIQAHAPTTTDTTTAGTNGGGGGGNNGGGRRGDDIGLVDSTILELMLAEDSRGLVGATDEDLKRLFGTGGGLSGSMMPRP